MPDCSVIAEYPESIEDCDSGEAIGTPEKSATKRFSLILNNI